MLLYFSQRLRRDEPTARAQNTLLAECVHFQGLLRPFGARAAFGGANRHPRITFRSSLLYRSDVVLPLKAHQEKEECKSNDSGTTSPLRGSCHCFAMGRTEGPHPAKAARKKRCRAFRDYFAPSGLVPPSAGRTDSTGTKYTPCGVCALSGTTSPLRGSCHCFAMGRTEGSYPAKVARKKRCRAFRDYFAPLGLVPPSAGRTDIRE